MTSALVDSSVVLDVLTDDGEWADWAQSTLESHGREGALFINPVVYAEVSIGYQRIEELDRALDACGLVARPVPREALFLAGKAYVAHRKRGGLRRSPLPDFFIGAHAAVTGWTLVTRDAARVQTYFPTVALATP